MEYNALDARFPNIELSYGTILHKTIQCDAVQILPKGKRCMLWFTYFNEENIAYLLSFDSAGININSVTKVITCFSNEMAFGVGTIISGVQFTDKSADIFGITDIHFYKGQNMSKCTYGEKYEYIAHMLSAESNQIAYINKQLIFASTILCQSLTEAIEISKDLSYDVYGYSCILFDKPRTKGIIKHVVNTNIPIILRIEPLSRCDMYNAYTADPSEKARIIAIPDYRTSVMMNNIFRNIKENSNLDLLEESDDDSEFENICDDKYVNLKTTHHMKCVYVPRLDKWKPVEICPNTSSLSSNNLVLRAEKKYKTNIYVRRRS